MQEEYKSAENHPGNDTPSTKSEENSEKEY